MSMRKILQKPETRSSTSKTSATSSSKKRSAEPEKRALVTAIEASEEKESGSTRKLRKTNSNTLFSHSASPEEKTQAVSRIFLPAHLSEAIKILRGDSEADTNCIQLTVNILAYLRTGIPPTQPAAVLAGTSAQVNLFPQADRSGKVTSFDLRNGSVELSQHSGRLRGTRCPQEGIREELKNAANRTGVPIYGFVVLVSANEKASHDGHVIPFYATPNKGEWAPYQVCFIDGHNISKNEYLAEPVLSKLSKGGYDFIDFNSRRERKAAIDEMADETESSADEVNVFQNDCFYFIEGPASVKVIEPHSEKDEGRRKVVTPWRLRDD